MAQQSPYPAYPVYPTHNSDSGYSSNGPSPPEFASTHAAQRPAPVVPLRQAHPSASHCNPSPPPALPSPTSPYSSYSSPAYPYSPTFTYPSFPTNYQLSGSDLSRQYTDGPESPNDGVYGTSRSAGRPSFESAVDEQRRTLPALPLRMPSYDRGAQGVRSLNYDRPVLGNRAVSYDRPALSSRAPSYERPVPYSRQSSESIPSWRSNTSSRGYQEHNSYEYDSAYTGSPDTSGRPSRERTDSSRSHESEGEVYHEASLGDRPDATTPFISKLAHLLSHPEYSHVIRWNAEGTVFIFAHGAPELLEVFSRFFRHSNTHSFVRQLNIYGFTRLSTLDLLVAIEGSPHADAPFPAGDYSGFGHPGFFRTIAVNPANLGHLKPKATKKKVSKPSIREQDATHNINHSPFPSPRIELPSLRMELPLPFSNRHSPILNTHPQSHSYM